MRANRAASGLVSRDREDVMTDDNDRVAYLAGEEGVEVDDVTRADLDELRSLLGDETVWAEPGDQLEDAVVAAIAAEAARTPTGEAPAEVIAPRAARRKRTFERHAGGAHGRRRRRRARRGRVRRLPRRRRRPPR